MISSTMGFTSANTQAQKKFLPYQPRQSIRNPTKLEWRHRSLAKSVIDHDKQLKTQNRNLNPQEKSQSLDKNHFLQNNFPKIDDSETNHHYVQNNNVNTNFNQKTGKFLKRNSALHDPETCVCDHCSCGRHLCKLHDQKHPNLHHISRYKKDYYPKLPLHNLIPIRHAQSPSTQGKIVPLSTYSKDFKNKAHSVDQRHKPEDCIKNGGPFTGLTTYGNGFPDFKSDMTYPKGKHLGGQHVANFPFMGNSTYRKEFIPKSLNSTQNEVKDSLRFGDSFLGNSTYKSNYLKPDTNYTNNWMQKRSSLNDPNFNHQYQTTYRNDFLKSRPTVCKAKVQLQTRSKGFYKNCKMSYLENSDFKAMDPEYHSMSTSKFS